MQRFLKLLLAAAFAAPACRAWPLSRMRSSITACPGVGMTVSGPVRELRLSVYPGRGRRLFRCFGCKFAGGSIPASRPVNDPSDQQIVIVRLGRALGPGTYTVSWRALSVDTHTTTGTFHFTVT